MHSEWEVLSEEMLEDQIFLADVNIAESPQVAERFKIVNTPTFILLRNRKMYIKPTGTGIEELRFWAKSGWGKDLPFDVPPENIETIIRLEAANFSAAVMAAVMAGRARYQNLLAETGSPVST